MVPCRTASGLLWILLLPGLAGCPARWAAQTEVATATAAAGTASPGSPGRILAAEAALADGDLVFRRGRDAMSAMVLARRGGSRFSHVGMLMVEGHRYWVIHAMPEGSGEPGGVRRELLADFLAPAVASDAAVYRVAALSPAARADLRGYLQSQLGKPFDFDFALSTPGRVYCSELVLRALRQAGVALQPDTLAVPLLSEPVVVPDALARLPGLVPVAGE